MPAKSPTEEKWSAKMPTRSDLTQLATLIPVLPMLCGLWKLPALRKCGNPKANLPFFTAPTTPYYWLSFYSQYGGNSSTPGMDLANCRHEKFKNTKKQWKEGS